MAAFFNLVRLVTGTSECNSPSYNPGQPYSKWVFVDEDDHTSCINEKDSVKCDANTIGNVVNTSQGRDESLKCSGDCTDNAAVISHDESAFVGKKTKNQKKKVRKKNRNRSNSTNSDSGRKKNVSFGLVEEVLFSREQGLGSVPSSGLFPLGFGNEEGRFEIPVDLHVSNSQVGLIERAQKLGICNDSGTSDSPHSPLETRQFDYRRGQNPLFHSSTEEERVLLLGSCVRVRSRSRAGSLGSDENVHTINESNKEIMDIRRSRISSPGCSCKSVKVDKLSVTKLKQELVTHQDIIKKTASEINALSKPELIAAVRDMLQSCPLCISNSCQCVQEGVGCHPEVCSCFKHNSRQECANEWNEKSYNFAAVDEYRKKYVSSKSSYIIPNMPK